MQILPINLNSYNLNFKNKVYFKGKSSLKNVKDIQTADTFTTMSSNIENGTSFKKSRDKFCDKSYKLFLVWADAMWEFYTNSTGENLKKFQEKQEERSKLYKDEEKYNEFVKYKNNSLLTEHEKKQLKNILKDFEDELKNGDNKKEIDEKLNEISQNYTSYIPIIDGKESSRTEISQILEKETDIEIRKKANNALLEGGNLIAEDLRQLVKMRNNYAKTQGYENYYEYVLKENYDIEPKELEKLLVDVHSKSSKIINQIIKKEQDELANFWGISPQELKSYHYRYLTKNNPEKKVNDYLKSKEQVVEICKNTYAGMGYDIDKLIEEGKLTLDLFPRKDKNTHGFAFTIDAEKDVRILVNLTNNVSSANTLNHELGHSVYMLGTSADLPYLDRDNYPALTEAIAMMMGDLLKRENILKKHISKDTLKEFQNTFINNEVKFITRALTIINFEKEMYKNPEQDLKKLWHDMKVKYQNRSENEDLDNEWATIPHYLSHPMYYQNYFRATIMKAQIYNYLVNKLGNISENKNTKDVLNNELFKYGTSLEENELIEKMTGKTLSVDDFIKNITKK